MMHARRLVLAATWALTAAFAAAGPAAAQRLVRVPQDARDILAAVSRVADGGVIEVAAGRYAAPPRGFNLGNLRKGFTLRAAPDAEVVLDGEGARPILRIQNGNRNRGKLIVFEDLTLTGGASDDATLSGAATLAAAEARFVRVRFLGNRTTGTGGAARATDGSAASFIDCDFRGNTTPDTGGALSVLGGSTAFVHRGVFEDNRINVPGHILHSAGGALYVVDATARVSESRFERNQAGWVGGAVFVFGTWAGPESVPRARVVVSHSTFAGNTVGPDACCTAPGVTSGGAVHAEDQATFEAHGSLFVGNRAEWGGAVSLYRSHFEAHGSVFRGNTTVLDGPQVGAGGAIIALSVDQAGEAVNRRPARVVVADSLFSGRAAPSAPAPAHTGGCIFVGGDLSRAGGEAENRARLELSRVVFSDCDVERKASGEGGLGGAVHAELTDLSADGSLVLGSDARGTGGGGGGFSVTQRSLARIAGTTFSRDSAERGGALFVSGSELFVSGASFLANEVSPGASESRGASIFTTPDTGAAARVVSGVVQGSLFSDDAGLSIWDVDPATGPINGVRYDDNRFFPTRFGDRVYGNTLVNRNGASVAELNALVVRRGGRGANQRLGSRPVTGALVALPVSLAPLPGSGAPPAGATVAYAWSGRSASAGDHVLTAPAGLLEGVGPGALPLVVDRATVAQAGVGAASCTVGNLLCMAGNRFRAEVAWKANDLAGAGRAVALTLDTGYFWFFDPANVELVTKLFDGRAANGKFWSFYGALSNVEYTLTTIDVETGRTWTYANPFGTLASGADTEAFPVATTEAGAASAASPSLVDLAAEQTAMLEEAAASAPAKAGTCVPAAERLCLRDGRFQVTLTFKDFAGKTGTGKAVPLTSDTGSFWFFSPANVEVVLKVLDGRPLNDHFWVFYGALSNVEYTLTVTDTVTGDSATYRNRLGSFGSRADTEALVGE